VRATACAAVAVALAATARADEAMDRAQRIHAHLIGVDSHNDTLQRVLHGHEDISRRTPAVRYPGEPYRQADVLRRAQGVQHHLRHVGGEPQRVSRDVLRRVGRVSGGGYRT